MNTVDILRAARAKIENPENWCQGVYFASASGERVAPWAAERWCATGAVWAVVGTGAEKYHERGPALHALCDAIGGEWQTDYNDTHTHAEVIAMFDRAIEAEERKAQ